MSSATNERLRSVGERSASLSSRERCVNRHLSGSEKRREIDECIAEKTSAASCLHGMALLSTIIETQFERLGLKTASRSRRATYWGHLSSLSGFNGCVNCRITTTLVSYRCSPAVAPMHTFKFCYGIAITVSSYGSDAATR